MIAALLLLVAPNTFIADDPLPPGVTVGGGPHHDLVLGPTGQPLYTYAGNGAGSAACLEDCLLKWTPLLAEENAKPVGDWQPVKGPDGRMIWVYKKRAQIFYHNGDAKNGEPTADGWQNAWYSLRFAGKRPTIVTPNAAKVTLVDDHFLLTDYRGMTLYTAGRGDGSSCEGDCLDMWRPLQAAELAQPMGDWKPVLRQDRVRQWSYKGQLLYSYLEDSNVGDTKGEGVGGPWKPIIFKR